MTKKVVCSTLYEYSFCNFLVIDFGDYDISIDTISKYEPNKLTKVQFQTSAL